MHSPCSNSKRARTLNALLKKLECKLTFKLFKLTCCMCTRLGRSRLLPSEEPSANPPTPSGGLLATRGRSAPDSPRKLLLINNSEGSPEAVSVSYPRSQQRRLPHPWTVDVCTCGLGGLQAAKPPPRIPLGIATVDACELVALSACAALC